MNHITTEASDIGEFLSLDPCELFKTTNELTILKTLQRMRLASFGLSNDFDTLMIQELDTVLLYANDILDIATLISNTRHRLAKIQTLGHSPIFAKDENLGKNSISDPSKIGSPKPEEQDACKCGDTETSLESHLNFQVGKNFDGIESDELQCNDGATSDILPHGDVVANQHFRQGSKKSSANSEAYRALADAVQELQSFTAANYLFIKHFKLVESHLLLQRIQFVLDTATRLLHEISVPRDHFQGLKRLLEHVPKMLKLQKARLAKVCYKCLASDDPSLVLESAMATLLLNACKGENVTEFGVKKREVYDQHIEKTKRALQGVGNGDCITSGIDGYSLVAHYLGTLFLKFLLDKIASYDHLENLFKVQKEIPGPLEGNSADTSAEDNENQILNLYMQTLASKFKILKLDKLKDAHLKILSSVDLYTNEFKASEITILKMAGIDVKFMLQVHLPNFKDAITKVWNDYVIERVLKRLEDIETGDLDLSSAVEELLGLVDVVDGNETLGNIAWPRMEHILVKQALFISSIVENANFVNDNDVSMVSLGTGLANVLESKKLDKALVALGQFPSQLQEHSTRCINDIVYYTLKRLCVASDQVGVNQIVQQGPKLKRPLLTVMIASKCLQLHLYKLLGFKSYGNCQTIQEATTALLKEVIDSQIHYKTQPSLNASLQQQPAEQPLKEAVSEAITLPDAPQGSLNPTESSLQVDDSTSITNADPTGQPHLDACNLDDPTFSSAQAPPDSIEASLLQQTEAQNPATLAAKDLHAPQLVTIETPQDAPESDTEMPTYTVEAPTQAVQTNTSHSSIDVDELSLVLLALQDGVYGDSAQVENLKQCILDMNIKPQESHMTNYQSFKALLI